MPTRTYLTTPPGREPSAATGRSASTPQERYVPALTAPREPRVPGRWRRPLQVIAAVAVLALIAAGIVAAVLATQTEDPALFDPALLGADTVTVSDTATVATTSTGQR
ncbi:hypothetical protein FTX61_11500 [Nitriliruptoraceae bacterium ZYF776]|nr:hypothetical protein [Profundirhabdus halotolerans]